MMRHFWMIACLCWLSTDASAEDTPAVPPVVGPHWITSPHSGGVKFFKEFPADAPIQQATLKFAADFCQATVSINGTGVLDVAPFCQTQLLDVTNSMRRGENTIRVRCSTMTDLSAIALSLDIRFVDGTAKTLMSDDSWDIAPVNLIEQEPEGRIERLAVVDRGLVAPELWGIGRRDISLSAYENYEQWQQSKGEVANQNRPKFWIAPGFEITELRVAQPDEGSWIAMAFDPQGRLTVSREDVGLLRMTLAEDQKSVAKVEKIDVQLEECRGLKYAGDVLYANANNSKGLFRLKLDDAGQVSDLVKLREFPGGVGHGRNDLALRINADNEVDWIYSIHGDSVALPSPPIKDLTSPLRETRWLPPRPEGYLIRMSPDDPNEDELWHAGLRNPYGVAGDRLGEMFTFDADNEHDMGTPWYRPNRILHLMRGGDSGYREVTGHLPPRFHDQPDHAPPLFDIGRASPTAVMFGDPLKFPASYRSSMFALDWTYGRVLAVHLFPRGESYRVNAETFLQGRPLNVTDIASGPDGAMYLTTGGRKTQSTLYRVAFVGDSTIDADSRGSEHEVCHLINRRCPEFTPTKTSDPVGLYREQIELERMTPDELLRLDFPSKNNVSHLLRLARTRQAEHVDDLIHRFITAGISNSNLTSQFIWVRIANLCLETSREAVVARRDKLIPEIVAAWKGLDTRPYSVAPEGNSVELRRRLAYLLGELGAEELPALAGPVLLASGVQEDQVAGLLALRNQQAGWTPELRRQQFETINSIPLMIGGAGLPPLEKWLREESMKTLSEAQKTELGSLLQPKPPEPEPLPPPRPLVQKWALSDLAATHAGDAPRGDAERGRLLFHEALCARCHRVGQRGAAVGPDLTHVSRRFSRRDVLESVLTPSLSVAENYRNETLTTHAGQVHTGRTIPEGDYRSEKVRLSTDPLDTTKVVEIDKKEIAEHATATASPMPSGLLDTLTLDQINDLLAFLESGGAGR